MSSTWVCTGPLSTARTYKSRTTARQAADRLDAEYGASVHGIKPK